MFQNLQVGLASNNFFPSFKRFIPNLSIVEVNDHYFVNYDLIIFPGGEDVDPSRYGEQNKYSFCNPERDKYEFLVLDKIQQLNRMCIKQIKVLGICRGSQLVNVGYGGSLWQDLSRQTQRSHNSWHPIEILADTEITRIFKNGVNSTHHQATRNQGSGLAITSTFKSIVESCESDNVITIQWHPEFDDFSPQISNLFFEYIESWVGERKQKENKQGVYFRPQYTVDYKLKRNPFANQQIEEQPEPFDEVFEEEEINEEEEEQPEEEQQ